MEQGEQITIKPVKQGERIRIRPAYQEMIRNLSTALVEDPSSGFRAKWAQAVGNKEWAEKINNYAEYPTLSSLLAAIPFPAKRALYKTLIEELEKTEVEGKRIFASTQDQKLTEILRRLNEPEVQDAIRKAYELPYWVDLDFLGDLVRALKTGAINKEEFLKILKEKGLSNPTVQQELAKIHGDIPKGFFSDRLAEITRERQSPQPLQQSVAEAVSNSIDAILIQQGQERSIGQWGRGIKMLLSYLDHPQDSIIVTTTQNNETWQIEIRKGGDNRLYLSSSKVESSSSSSQSPTEEPKQNGTTLRLKKYEPLTQDFLEQLKQRLKNRFGVVKEVMIKINNEQINKDEIIDVKEDKPIPRDHSLGEVNVTLDPKEIKVEDNGCGMNPDQLLSMFITGAGSKPFVEINDQNRESYLDLIQVFYYEDKTNDKQDKKQSAIEFTRNGETILSLPLSSDKTNLFDRTLSFELGPLLQTSDARESVIINKNFEEAVKRSVDIIIEGKLDPEKKITALNSLIAALTYLGGRKKGEKKTDIFITVSSIISYANKKAKPLINDLSSKGYIFMPNYEEFSHLKLADDKKTVFVDPLLFSFDPEKLNLPGFEQIKPSIFKSSTGQKLFLADFKDATTSPIITYEGGFILDRKVWQKIISLKETNPQDFEVLVEALELRLNPISTSYDPHEEPLTNLQNRLVFKETREEETRRETVEWPNWLINRDQKEKLENILKYIKEIDGNAGPIYTITLSPDGKKVLYGGINGKLMMVDLENQKAPPKEIATVTFINAITLSPDGKKVFYGGGNGKLMMVDLESSNNYQERLTDLINLAEKLYAFSPYPQKIINSLVQFFSDKRDLKIENIDQMVNFLSDERNTRFIQNLFENIPPEINQLNEEEKSRFMSRFLVNLLEASFQISTSENAQELLNTLFDERNNLHLLLDFSLINLQQDKNILEQIKKLISTEENLLQRQIYFSLINGFFFVEKDPIKRQVFLDKLIRINENTAYQRYLKSLASYSEEEIIDLFSKDFLEKETPGRALIEFLKKEGGIALTTYTSLTELTQAWGVSEQNQSVFQREISITEILDQYRIKGRRKWEEVVDAINQTSSTNLNLEPFRQEIIKEVLGQAIEEGIARREMIQNGVDAIKKRQELTEGKIGIHLFKANDEKGECLIEEFTDNGTGVVDWLKFFIPGETTKDASDQGFFGSGAFKIFEGVDRVDILSSTDGKTAYYFRFEWENNNLVIKKSQFIGEFSGEQGTRIRRIKKLNDQDIPEFEAGIISDDYVAFTGLLTNEQINGKTINVSINNETINTQRRKRLSEKFSYNGVEYGEITLVESRLPPTVAHGIGLRMSDLDERYLTYVPQQLKELIKRKKISIVLPKELPLIKDRSRIANEEELFDPLARKIAGMVIKLAAQELILGFKQRNKSGDSYRIWKPPGFPDDWFTNPQYSRLYASEELGYINDIIIKLNKNEVLTPKELSLINQPFDLQSRLAMVIVGLNVNLPDSTTSNLRQERLKVLINTQRQFTSQLQEDNPLLKRLRELIELEASINSQFGISSPETSVSDPTPITTQEYQEQGEKVIQFFLGKIDERDIKEDQLNEIQKQNLKLLRNIASVFNISVFPKANIGAAGYFSDDNKFIIDVETLSSPPAYFVETAFHELAHYKENLSQQHLGPIYTHLFTHQVDGPFGQAYYQVLEEILTKYPPQPTIN